MSQFYVTLPSDSSMNFYPDNTVAHFNTKLAQRLHLDGDYEVAITEFIYPNSWLNFNDSEKSIQILDFVGSRSFPITKHIFKSGHYASEIDLIKDINEQLNTENVGIEFDFDISSRKIILEINGALSLGMRMNDAFKKYFGFEEKGPYRNGHYTSKKPFDLNAGLRLMYIYSDIVSYSAVGDTMTPLLRVCNVTGSHGEETSITFTRPQYVPVAHRDIENIEININNELGQPMSFMFGKSVVTLHFRRKHNLSDL